MVEGSVREFKRKNRAMTPSERKAFLSGRKAGKTLPDKPSPTQRSSFKKTIEDKSAKAGTKKSTEQQLFYWALAKGRKGKKKVTPGVKNKVKPSTDTKETKTVKSGGSLTPEELRSYLKNLRGL